MKKLVVLCVLLLYSCSENDDLEQISYSEFQREVISDNVQKVTIKGDQQTIVGTRLDGTTFETIQALYKNDELVNNALQENKVIVVNEKPEQPSISSQLLIGALPLIVIILFIPLSFAIWAAYLASNRNQSKALWFFLTLFFPFAIVVIAFKDKVEKN